MAAPSKFTPLTVERLCKAIRLGATYELACKSAGISYDTLNNWRKGKSFPAGTTKAEKVQFFDAIEKAEGDAVLHWLGKIEDAANEGTWQAAAWKLERRYPREYGRTVQEHSGEVSTVVIREIHVPKPDRVS
jgi:hypothetical protein